MRYFSGRPSKLSKLLARLRAFAARFGFGWGHHLKLGDAYRLGTSKVRVPLEGLAIEVILGLGDKRLHLYPETRIGPGGKPIMLDSYLVVDPRTHLQRIGGFLRLTPKSWLAIGSGDPLQQALFEFPPAVDEQHLVVIYGRDSLAFRNLGDAGTSIAPVIDDPRSRRTGKFRRLRAILGGPVELLTRADALSLIEDVNRLMRGEAYRTRDDRGLPGGLLSLPERLAPIIVADLHAQVDNLLTVLTQNAFLDGLEDGTAALVILGDAVHAEEDGRLREMESSMILMDLIFRLKQRFPGQVFYVRGNHDSFSEDIAKAGIPQGLLWAKELGERRGNAYLKAMGEFYALLPYVVIGQDFVACHAAAPTMKVSREMLVNIHRHPKLILDLINNRLRKANRPQGYWRGDIKRFRHALDLDPSAAFIVGHTPLDREHTLWLDVDGIDHHHVLFSANPDQVGVFTRVGGMMVPLIYPVDSLTPILNGIDVERA